jgi:hypothetical protein
MKSRSSGCSGFVFKMACSILVIVVMGGTGALIGFKLVAASNFAAASSMLPNPVTPTPSWDHTLGLSVTSGPEGMHVFISS